MEHTAKVGLGFFDRVVLVSAWLLSCAAVYGLGFYTGSHTQERMPGDEDRIVRLPVTSEPPPAGQRVNDTDDLSFWGVLESGGPRSKPGEGIRTPAVPAASAAAPKADAPAKAAAGQAKAATRTPARRAGTKPAPGVAAAAKQTPRKQPASASAAAPSRPPAKPAAAKSQPPAAASTKRPPRAPERKLERAAPPPPAARDDGRAVQKRSVVASE